MDLSRRRKYTKKACIACKTGHLACDDTRPCKRCVAAGKPEQCIDAIHRKRGRPKMEENRGKRRLSDSTLTPEEEDKFQLVCSSNWTILSVSDSMYKNLIDQNLLSMINVSDKTRFLEAKGQPERVLVTFKRIPQLFNVSFQQFNQEYHLEFSRVLEQESTSRRTSKLSIQSLLN